MDKKPYHFDGFEGGRRTEDGRLDRGGRDGNGRPRRYR